jgi:hypothetical protein
MANMNKILSLSLLVLLACTPDAPEAQPDAAPPTPDASVVVDAQADARTEPRAPKQGCTMGNLPTARTITLVNGDPLPPDLINEMQDQFGKLTDDDKPLFIAADGFCLVNAAAGAPALTWTSAGAVWSLPGDNTVSHSLDLRVGTIITGISVSSNRPLLGPATAYLTRRSFGDGGVTFGVVASKSITVSGAWSNTAFSAGLPYQILDGFLYSLVYEVPLGAPSPVLFDGFKITTAR